MIQKIKFSVKPLFWGQRYQIANWMFSIFTPINLFLKALVFEKF